MAIVVQTAFDRARQLVREAVAAEGWSPIAILSLPGFLGPNIDAVVRCTRSVDGHKQAVDITLPHDLPLAETVSLIRVRLRMAG